MSEPTPAPALTQRHYQALAGLALAAIFLLQLQHGGTFVVNLFVLLLGAVGLLYRVRLNPILVLCVLATPMLAEQYNLSQFNVDFRSLRTFNVNIADVLLCVAILTYLIGQYRLQGLWFGVLPADPRLSPNEAARAEASMSAMELLGLVVPIPAAALFAQLACLLLRQPWTLIDLPPHWRQFLALAWTLLLVMFLAAHAFRYWRRLQMDRTTALLMLQDVLWRETYGEQRRINRWIVWKKLRGRS